MPTRTRTAPAAVPAEAAPAALEEALATSVAVPGALEPELVKLMQRKTRSAAIAYTRWLTEHVGMEELDQDVVSAILTLYRFWRGTESYQEHLQAVAYAAENKEETALRRRLEAAKARQAALEAEIAALAEAPKAPVEAVTLTAVPAPADETDDERDEREVREAIAQRKRDKAAAAAAAAAATAVAADDDDAPPTDDDDNDF